MEVIINGVRYVPFVEGANESSILEKKIQYLRLSRRTENALLSEKILTVADLVKFKEYELLKTPNIGRETILEIKVALGSFGIFLTNTPNFEAAK